MFKSLSRLARSSSAIEIAIAITLAHSFTNLLESFVNEVILPPLGLLLGGRSMASLFINLTPNKTFQGKIVDSIEKARFAGSPTIAYGLFLSYLITFIIVLLVGLVALRILARSNGVEVE